MGELKKERNLKKEYEWDKNKYKRLQIKMKKEEAEEFLNLLKKENLGYTEFFKQQIKKYIEEKKEGKKENGKKL